MASGIVDQHPQQIRAAIYARVSTVNNGQDPAMQTRELREYCERRGWIVVNEYVDIGISGAKDRRPQLDRLMADGRRRKFDVIVVWRFDRFARSVRHLLRALGFAGLWHLTHASRGARFSVPEVNPRIVAEELI